MITDGEASLLIDTLFDLDERMRQSAGRALERIAVDADRGATEFSPPRDYAAAASYVQRLVEQQIGRQALVKISEQNRDVET